MEFSKFTESAVAAMSCAQNCAAELRHGFVGSEHLLMGLIKCGDATSALLKKYGVTAEAAEPYIDSVVGGGRSRFTDSYGNTQSVKRILELALYEAKSFGCELIGTEHILLSVMRERDCMGARIIDSLCSDKQLMKRELSEGGPASMPEEYAEQVQEPYQEESSAYRPQTYTADVGAAVKGRGSASSTPVLDSYSRDLTAQAVLGRLDPVIGRDSEISRVILTLCRRSKNNPVLIGEPGVGKTAVVEGLAGMIASGAVPEGLKGCRILSLDIGAMIAGTKYRGEFEERFKAAVDELAVSPETILFIDEIHTIVGAGASEGSVDAANILKPALARGELRLIGATTIEEYRRFIERDAALERRFSPILVNEPSAEQTASILRGLAPRYEQHHRVSISDEAIEAAIELSVRFMADRRLPDKAIDLIDEACAAVRLAPVQTAAEGGQNLRAMIEDAAAKGEYELADSLRKQLAGSAPVHKHDSIPTVTAADVETVAAERTGLDVASVKNGLDDLESRLKQKVFGQDAAINSVASALRRSAAGLGDPEKPFAVLCFIGGEASGRETLAVRLAEELFCGSVIRLNGAELADEAAVYRLAGAPRSMGGDKGGTLTEYVRLHPFSVVMIKHAEQCSRGASELFTKLVSEGVTEDGGGRTVSFRNCVFVFIVDDTESKRLGFGADANSASAAVSRAKEALPGGIAQSLDALIPFDRHTEKSILKIALFELDRLKERALARGVELTVEPSAAELVAARCAGYAGAVRQIVSSGPEDALSIAILRGEVASGCAALCMAQDGKFIIKRL